MISPNTFAFALVLVAAVCGVLALTIFGLRLRTQELASALSTTERRCTNALARLADVEKMAPTALAARVEELSEAVERLRRTHQRFAGRFDQAMRPRGGGSILDGDTGQPLAGDDELEAMLALQRANPVRPG